MTQALLAAVVAAFPLLVLAAAASDLATMKIPNRVSFLLAGAFLLYALVAGVPASTVLAHLAAGLLVLLLGFACFAAGWIGGGDAKFAAAIALWLGFDHILRHLLEAAILGGALTVALLALRSIPLPAFALGWNWLTRLHHPKSGIPYGIALAAAALVVLPDTPFWKAVA